MQAGALVNGHIDVPQLAFAAFVVFFFGLVYHLRREDKREGYPMRASPFSTATLDGFPLPPQEPKVYEVEEGGLTAAPHHYPLPDIKAAPLHGFDGTPLVPVENPLLSALGPATYVMRLDEPALTEQGERMLRPLRDLPEWSIEHGETDPRGMFVYDRRWHEVGRVADIWIDCSVKMLRYFEVELEAALGGRRVLVPLYFTHIKERAREIRVTALYKAQFSEIPALRTPGEITAREEDRLLGYFAGGRFFGDRDPASEARRRARRRWGRRQ